MSFNEENTFDTQNTNDEEVYVTMNKVQAYKIDTNGKVIDTILVDEGTANTADTITTPYPDGMYDPTWDATNSVWVSGFTDTQLVTERLPLKIGELKLACAGAIYSGFTSALTDANGVAYEFGFNEHDQKNFNSRTNRVNQWYAQLNAGVITQTEFDAKFPIEWKTKNLGSVNLTYDEFLQVVDEADSAFMTKQKKYWDLEAQAYAATTQAELDAVVW